MQAVELTVTIKGDDSTYKQKFLLYGDIVLSENDEQVKSSIQEALAMTQFEPEEIKLRANVQIR